MEKSIEEQLIEIGKNLIIFPGNKSEFEEMIGMQTNILDFSDSRNKGVFYGPSRCYKHKNPFDYNSIKKQKKILEFGGIDAIINSRHVDLAGQTGGIIGGTRIIAYYGLPVKRIL